MFVSRVPAAGRDSTSASGSPFLIQSGYVPYETYHHIFLDMIMYEIMFFYTHFLFIFLASV